MAAPTSSWGVAAEGFKAGAIGDLMKGTNAGGLDGCGGLVDLLGAAGVDDFRR